MSVRLAATLAASYGLDERQAAQLEDVLGALDADEHAPTAVRAREEAVDVHLADSLSGLGVAALASARRIADLGTGAGFPGLPLAIALPGAEVRLVEGQRRKCDFLTGLCSSVAIENVTVVWARAEEWSEGLGSNQAVTARALAPQSVVLEYAAPLLEVGGVLVDWRGRRSEEEERMALAAAEQLGMARMEVRRVQPFTQARDRHLHVFEKVAETPARFPRRAGMARKRPLGL